MATASLSEDASLEPAHSTPNNMTESLSLVDTGAHLKQQDMAVVPASSSPNININMNNQEDLQKLAEKALNTVGASPVLTPLKALNTVGASPVLTPLKALNRVGASPVLKTPEQLKSNILKAQVEAVLRGTREEGGLSEEKNCNLQEAANRLMGRGGTTGSTSSLPVGGRAEPLEAWEALKQPSLRSCSPGPEEVPEFMTTAPSTPAEPKSEALSAKLTQGRSEEQELCAVPQSDNLIDFTDPNPGPTQVQLPKPITAPRWIVPATTHAGTFTNGLLELDCTAKISPHQPERGTLTSLPHLSHTHNVTVASVVTLPPKNNNHKPKTLLTTEL